MPYRRRAFSRALSWNFATDCFGLLIVWTNSKANPTALLLSGIMMLRHMNLFEHAAKIEHAALSVRLGQIVTCSSTTLTVSRLLRFRCRPSPKERRSLVISGEPPRPPNTPQRSSRSFESFRQPQLERKLIPLFTKSPARYIPSTRPTPLPLLLVTLTPSLDFHHCRSIR